MSYSSVQVADRFISLGKEKSLYFSNIHLNRLLYIAHGISLISDDPLINENVYAWSFGPVYPMAYSESLQNESKGKIQNCSRKIFPTAIKNHHDFIIKALVSFEASASVLDNDGPWAKTWKSTPYLIIPQQLIKDYFLNLSEN